MVPAYNSTVHKATGFSPFSLFGHEPGVPKERREEKPVTDVLHHHKLRPKENNEERVSFDLFEDTKIALINVHWSLEEKEKKKKGPTHC